jgi:decaprenylphospho-beta-D-erythro-pentofuranosid-2-ulose 2-reductase
VSAALLVGGSSDIGSAVLASLLPAEGCTVVLAGRPSVRRRAVAAELSRRHAVHTVDWVVGQRACGDTLLTRATRVCGRPMDLVVVAVGELGGPLRIGAEETDAVRRQLAVNLTAPLEVVLASTRQVAPGGRIVVLTSASAVRPRRGIAVYSVAKQALDQLSRMAMPGAAERGVRLHVVRPGHVRTAMTAGLPQPPLTRSPEQVARDVVRGVERGTPVIWSPSAMRLVMAVLRCAPRGVVPASLR